VVPNSSKPTSSTLRRADPFRADVQPLLCGCGSARLSWSGWEVGDQVFDAAADFVADRADGVDALAGGVVELPVQVALAGACGGATRLDAGAVPRQPLGGA
jgi:hypothetical protein